MESYEFLITDHRRLEEIKEKYKLSLDEEYVYFPSIIYIVKINNSYNAKIIDGALLSGYIRYLEDMWD